MNQRTDPLAAQRMDRPTVHLAEHAPSQRDIIKSTLTDDEYKLSVFKVLADQQLELQRISRQVFNSAHPVDEYEVIGQNANIAGVTIRPDTGWQQRYECIMYSLGLGITVATLTIAGQTLQLYNGPAITAQQVTVLPHLGILAGFNEDRYLTITGAPTSDGFIKLMGYAFKRDESGT